MRPHVRQAGAGATVLCLHANASSSSQWRGLMDLLAPQFRVLAPDGLGAGRSPPWPAGGGVRLADEVRLLAPLLQGAGARFHVVGHSYGAAVAARLALDLPQRVASLTLYEPALFALLEAEQPGHPDVVGIAQTVAAAGAAVDRGDLDAAGAHFIDYWVGAGAWAATPEARRAPMAAAVRHVRGWAEALFAETTPLSAYAALPMPVSLLGGATTPASARGVLRLLSQALPQAAVHVFPGIGHMGPLTHPAIVNAQIARFLAAQPPP